MAAHNKPQIEIARKITSLIKNHPEYDADRVKVEIRAMLDVAYSDRSPLKDLFSFYQDIQKGIDEPGNTNYSNCLVAYLLGLTTKKPDGEYNLEPRRTYARDGFPDCDIDICYERRSEVIDYIIKKYGRENVANIGNIGKLHVSSALRKAVKVLDPTNTYNEENKWGQKLPKGGDPNFQLQNDICDTLPDMLVDENGEKIKNLKEAYDAYPEFREYMDRYPEVYEYASAIEGVIQNYSSHAAGFVISPIPMAEICPLHVTKRKGDELDLATQFTMSEVESLGLIKMDLLGQSSLTAINRATRQIQQTYQIAINQDTVPFQDPKTLALCNKGETVGCFQLEHGGMQDTLRTIGVDGLEDLVLAIAMFRPGPLQHIQELADIKKGKQKPTYLHPKMKDIASRTHSVLVFQEQVMRAFVDIGGLTESEGYTFIKGCAKKKKELIDSLQEKFIKGCRKSGIPDNVATGVWNDLYKHSGYSFNECLSGRTEIVDENGVKYTLEEIAKSSLKGIKVKSKIIDDKGTSTVSDEIVRAFSTGKKIVFEVKLSNGMVIDCTWNHKFLCSDNKFRTVQDIYDKALEIVWDDGADENTQKCKISSMKMLSIYETFNMTMKSDQHNYAIFNNGKFIYTKNSHAVGYAVRSFVTSYLKAHFPAEFMTARLTVEYIRKVDKLMTALRQEVLRMGFKILPPDINLSGIEWQIVDKKILREPLIVKGIGIKAAQDIIANRPYVGEDLLYDFAKKAGSAINSRIVEFMYFAGMWGRGKSKEQIVSDFEKIRRGRHKAPGGMDLFGSH